MTSIRLLKAEEGLLLKHLRLSALQESPDSFSPTYEESSLHDDDYWLHAAQRIVATGGFEIFIAENQGSPCGLVSGQQDQNQTGHIGAMWVAPDARGSGTGRSLLNRVIDYLSQRGCSVIKLTVTETNENAINLYRRAGFTLTSEKEPLRSGSLLMNLEMSRTEGVAEPDVETD